MIRYYLAVDIGASSGRHMLGWLENGKMQIQEVHRFQNGMKEINGSLCWDVDQLFKEVIAGLKKCREMGRFQKAWELTRGGMILYCWMRTVGGSEMQSAIGMQERMAWTKRCTVRFRKRSYMRVLEFRS